jgi:Xaa-Pro dipeptidase
MRVDRRDVLGLGGLAALAAAASTRAGAEKGLPEAIARLGSMVEGLEPIAPSEHLARIERARALMAQAGLDAVVMGGGSTLLYFTGLRPRT